MDNYLQANQQLWNEWTALHEQAPRYNLAGFKAGASTLRPVERAELTDVAGKRLLHLQCHFGLDTLSWAREGANRCARSRRAFVATACYTTSREPDHLPE